MRTLFYLSILFLFFCCKHKQNNYSYKSKSLEILQINEHIYQHISYLESPSFGRVNCNGMLLIYNQQAFVYDTPVDDSSSEELIQHLNQLGVKIKAVIPHHFHNDCLGGLEAFHRWQIPSYALSKTIELAKQTGEPIPQNAFQDSLILKIGHFTSATYYFGEGHSPDNIVSYLPETKTLFGGCLIKCIGASKGYLGDANVEEWSETVKKLQATFPHIEQIIPGHGKSGNETLLDYTIKLFE